MAAYASYVHQRSFALRGGADGASAALWPLSVHGLLFLATVGLLKPPRHASRRARHVVWMAFLLGIGVSPLRPSSRQRPLSLGSRCWSRDGRRSPCCSRLSFSRTGPVIESRARARCEPRLSVASRTAGQDGSHARPAC
ncbi:DUF2637 domain-containing protein [Streptomyces sp. NPDC086777]|uniref:DUF2637 domain-containing protein n=1 Tax=Streptomyces sp. NPDC086777 TaxID=3154866 RepID=UPI00344EBB2F